MFRSLTEFLGQMSETAESVERNAAEPIEQGASENDEQEVDWSTALEESVGAVWNGASDTEGAVEEFDEPKDDGDDDAGWGDEDELEPDELEESEDVDEDDELSGEQEESADELNVATSADDAGSDTDDTDGLWDLLLESFSEPDAENKKKSSSSSASSASADELEQLKKTVETLVAWQSAVQEYLQTSIEAENIRTVAQQLASLGVILPDDQIQEIARTSQQLGIPPSVLLKAKAYDYTMQKMHQQGQVPYPFMVNTASASFPSSPPSPIPNPRPFRPEEPGTLRTSFTRLEDFLRQMGISE